MTPLWGNTILCSPSSPSHAMLPELQRYNNTVRCAVLGAEVPGHRQEHPNLDCAFVESALLFVVPKIGLARAPQGPPCPPP